MILFVCSQAQLRSRTAELLCLFGGIDARCCGTDDTALVPVNDTLIRCARQVICMESAHLQAIENFMHFDNTIVHVLEIPDKFNRLCPLLCAALIRGIASFDPALAAGMQQGANVLLRDHELHAGLL